MITNETQVTTSPPRRFGWLHVLGFMLLAVIVTAGVTVWIIRSYVLPSEFKPVTLNAQEEQVLAEKLDRLDRFEVPGGSQGMQTAHSDSNAPLEPEPYSEEGADRSITFTEREVNALVAKNTDLARKLAIDLSDDLLSAKLLVPVDEDFPVLGGKIVKVKAGLELAYRDGRPIVALRGISIMGVPLPNAWLGGIKNIDLVREYGAEEGFWQAFAAGVEDIRVEQGRLRIALKE